MNGIYRMLFKTLVLPLILATLGEGPAAFAGSTDSYFNSVKHQPTLLRDFLYRFPKGGELHTHLDGAAYAESYVAWAASDGRCIDLSTYTITPPPCAAEEGRPAVAEIQLDAGIVNQIIDALSVRNYTYGSYPWPSASTIRQTPLHRQY